MTVAVRSRGGEETAVAGVTGRAVDATTVGTDRVGVVVRGTTSGAVAPVVTTGGARSGRSDVTAVHTVSGTGARAAVATGAVTATGVARGVRIAGTTATVTVGRGPTSGMSVRDGVPMDSVTSAGTAVVVGTTGGGLVGTTAVVGAMESRAVADGSMRSGVAVGVPGTTAGAVGDGSGMTGGAAETTGDVAGVGSAMTVDVMVAGPGTTVDVMVAGSAMTVDVMVAGSAMTVDVVEGGSGTIGAGAPGSVVVVVGSGRIGGIVGRGLGMSGSLCGGCRFPRT
ncbi:hypothetical protein [Streptomyces sulphureus]|uniref:hypothetical protein n=1 Tax=Streptomyces sulphureus TaxID=47758 RepID=UPI00036DF723|nr:hypothetical protein [Streptomyces sulphureus]